MIDAIGKHLCEPWTPALLSVPLFRVLAASFVAGGTFLQVYLATLVSAGASTIAGLLGLSGMAAWVPAVDHVRRTNPMRRKPVC